MAEGAESWMICDGPASALFMLCKSKTDGWLTKESLDATLRGSHACVGRTDALIPRNLPEKVDNDVKERYIL